MPPAAMMAMSADLPARVDVVDEADVVAMPAAIDATSASAQAEALSALTNLGYGPGEAAPAVAEAAGAEPNADTAALIRAALKKLAPA